MVNTCCASSRVGATISTRIRLRALFLYLRLSFARMTTATAPEWAAGTQRSSRCPSSPPRRCPSQPGRAGCTAPTSQPRLAAYLNGRRRGETHFVDRAKQRTREAQLVERARQRGRRRLRLFGEELLVRGELRRLPTHALNTANHIFAFGLGFLSLLRPGLSSQILFLVVGGIFTFALLFLSVRKRGLLYLATI